MRNRNMYYMTGLPGWMRFGYSPGWVGRSPSGLGPCAEYLMSGRWPTPQMAAAWPATQMGQMPMPGVESGPPPIAGTSGYPMAQAAAGQMPWLQEQAQILQQQLDRINAEIERLQQVGP